MSTGKLSVIGWWLIALFWCAVSAPILFFVPSQVRTDWVAAFAFLFPAVGVGFVVHAVRQTLALVKFGNPVFRLATLPAPLGRELKGSIETWLRRPPAGGVLVKLTCIRRVGSGSGRSRSVWEHILWRDDAVVPSAAFAPTSQGVAIPVRFALPADQPATNGDNPDNAVIWRLDATASMPGIDFEARFDVPVFRTADSPPEAAGAEADRPAVLPAHPQSVARVTPRGGREFVFPPDRNPRLALGLTVFWLLWSGAVALLLRARAPLIFPLAFGAVDLLLFWGVLKLWFGRSVVVCEDGVVSVRNSLFGLGRTRSARTGELLAVEAPITMQTGDGSGTPFYGLRLRCRDGRTLDAGFEIRDKHEAEWLVAELRRAAGLASPSGRDG